MCRLKACKNKILAFGSALVLAFSVLVPCVDVSATEMEETRRYLDANEDGEITLDEFDDYTLPYRIALNIMGVAMGSPTSAISLADKIAESEAYQNFLAANEPAELVIGYEKDGDLFYFSDGVFDVARDIFEEEVGYFVIPPITSDDILDYASTLSSSYYEDIYNKIVVNESSHEGRFIEFDASITSTNNDLYRSVVVTDIYADFDSTRDFFYKSGSASFYQLYVGRMSSSGTVTSAYDKFFDAFVRGYHSESISSYSVQPWYNKSDSYRFGCLNHSLVVFNSPADYVEFIKGRSTVYCSSDSVEDSTNVSIKIDTLNNADWEEVNNSIYNTVVNNVTNMESPTVSDVQTMSDAEFAKLQEALDILAEGSYDSNQTLDEILAQLTEDGERQSSWLKKIYDLLVEWFPKLGGDTNVEVEVITPEEEEEEKNKIDDFESNSDSQSNALDELNTQNKVDKIDVDNASSSVDTHIDMESVGQYGTLLTSVTSNEKVLSMLLGALAISLIAYVLYGKR